MNTAKNIMARNKGNEISCEIPLFWKKQTCVDGRENHILEWKYFFLCLSGPSIHVFFFYSQKKALIYIENTRSPKRFPFCFFSLHQKYLLNWYFSDGFQLFSMFSHVNYFKNILLKSFLFFNVKTVSNWHSGCQIDVKLTTSEIKDLLNVNYRKINFYDTVLCCPRLSSVYIWLLKENVIRHPPNFVIRQ